MWTEEARNRHAPRQERYPSDLTDAEWNLIKPLIPDAQRGGRPRKTDMREVMNAVRYVLRTGCQWRQLPKDFPPRSTVYSYFLGMDTLWRSRSNSSRAPHGLPRSGRPRGKPNGRHYRHSSGEGGRKRGRSRDPVKGIKRNALVDTIGLLLGIEAIPANVQDRDAAAELIKKTRRLFPFVKHVFADGGYQGDKLAADLAAQRVGFEIVKRTDKEGGFKVVRRRWVVERTFSWLRRNRRLMAHYEAIAMVAEGFAKLAMISVMLKRNGANPQACLVNF